MKQLELTMQWIRTRDTFVVLYGL